MYGLVIFIHIITCILLITIILIQRGRGGGLVESFSGVESIFGPRTNVFLVRATTILAVIFMCTCLILTFFSIRESKSLLERTEFKKEIQSNQTTPTSDNKISNSSQSQ